jgi:dihydroflavonol-4-reductase
MNVLVTGSTGFVGGQLCRALCAQGHTVRAFHRPSSPTRALDGLAVEHALGDLTQPDSVAAAMQGMEVVFHVAALLGGDESPGRMYAVTVEGTRAVLNAALRAGVRRLVHTSSVAALGVPDMRGGQSLPIDEQHAWNYRPDRWPYGYAKYLAEMEVQKAVAQGLDAVIVNPSVVFGAGDIYRQSSSIIMQTARRRLPALTEGGVNAVHIDHVIAGHLAALERGATGERYILGGENMSHVKLVRRIAKITGVSAPLLVLPASMARLLVGPLRLVQAFVEPPIPYRSFYLAGYRFYYDTHKAVVELGLNQPLPVDQAIAEAYAWFREKQGKES